jgi:hypothetical protein
MEALLLYNESVAKIENVHRNLTKIYFIVYKGKSILKRYESKRLKEFGNDLIPIRVLVEDTGLTEDEKKELVLKWLYGKGINCQHWSFDRCFLCELEYMIKALHIRVEPEFNFKNMTNGDHC